MAGKEETILIYLALELSGKVGGGKKITVRSHAKKGFSVANG